MDILSSIMALFCANKMNHSEEDLSGKNVNRENPGEKKTGDETAISVVNDDEEGNYSDIVSRMQAICNVLPDSEMLLDVDNGEICMRLKWKPSPETSEQKSSEEQDIETKGSDTGNAETKSASPFSKLYTYLKRNYAFRYNSLTEQTECAKIQAEEKEGGDGTDAHRIYLPVDSRLLNGICLSAMDSGIRCWDRDVRRYVESDKIEEYHPFLLYLDTLPAWDGTDRITSLAKRVSDSPVWVNSFHRWMLATTAQWMGFGDSNRANSVAPILISTRQGWGKSTFCRMLMPERLNRYFTESYDLNMPSAAESKLATFGIINMDEFDKFPVKKMPLLKNLIQMESLNIRKAYKRSTEPHGRIASFIGTSNRRDLLTDASGSRRFICVELTHAIDCSPVDHDQIYAQLKQELKSGERYWFSKEEERDIQAANRAFYRTAPEEDVFHSCLRFAAPEEEGAKLLTATEIFEVMRKKNLAAMRGTTCNAVSRMLPAMGQRVHTKYCNGYWVKDIN